VNPKPPVDQQIENRISPKDGGIQASVIIISYNVWEELERCLRSLEITRDNVEIIVVENASTDGSPDVECSYSKQLLSLTRGFYDG
jgi:hypothetical protein